MRTPIFFLTIFLLTACNRTSDEKLVDRTSTDAYDDSVKKYADRILTDAFQDSMREVVFGPNLIGGIPNIILQPFTVDSTDLKTFISTIVKPIINKDKKKVLANMDFPVLAELFSDSDVDLVKITRDEFSENYDWFFNPTLIESLSYEYQSIKDIRVLKTNDTLWYLIVPSTRDKGPADSLTFYDSYTSASLMFFKQNGQFKLKHLLTGKNNFYKDAGK